MVYQILIHTTIKAEFQNFHNQHEKFWFEIVVFVRIQFQLYPKISNKTLLLKNKINNSTNHWRWTFWIIFFSQTKINFFALHYWNTYFSADLVSQTTASNNYALNGNMNELFSIFALRSLWKFKICFWWMFK